MEGNISQRRKVLDVLGVKRLYETMLRDKYNLYRQFSVDSNTKNGDKNFGYFEFIGRRCRSLDIKPEEFLAVMFSKPTKMQLQKKFKYPYLGFLASEGAFAAFVNHKGEIARCFGSEEGGAKRIKAMEKATSPTNFEAKFSNCYYGGFPLFYQVYQAKGLAFIKNLYERFALFLAFNEIFTPEFIATHAQFKKYAWRMGNTQEKRAVQVAVNKYVAEVTRAIARNTGYKFDLYEARFRLRARERISVKQMHGHKKGWATVWLLLD